MPDESEEQETSKAPGARNKRRRRRSEIANSNAIKEENTPLLQNIFSYTLPGGLSYLSTSGTVFIDGGSVVSNGVIFSADSYRQLLELEQALIESRQELAKERDVNEQQKKELEAQEKYFKLYYRVNEHARQHLQKSEKFRRIFDQNQECECVVLSIDLRDSTELMLRSRAPELFAAFITNLSNQLRSTVLENFGIFDKFTGDGILALFPDFFSGPDALYYALRAARKAMDVFGILYENSRNSFSLVAAESGLGVGIDAGTLSIVSMGSDFTAVGYPVVYACRLSSAPAGQILLNQGAECIVSNKYQHSIGLKRTTIDFKKAKNILAYQVDFVDPNYLPENPTWP